MKGTTKTKRKEGRSLRFSEADVMKYASLLSDSYANKDEAREILSGREQLREAALYKGHKEGTLLEALTEEQISQLRKDTKETSSEEKSISDYCRVIHSASLILLYGLRVTTFEREYYNFCYNLATGEGEIGKYYEEISFQNLKQAAKHWKCLILALANFGKAPYYVFFAKKIFTGSMLRFMHLTQYYEVPTELYKNKRFKKLSFESVKVSNKEILEELDFVATLINKNTV